MPDNTTSDILAAASSAVTGSETPNAIRLVRPAPTSAAILLIAMAVVSIGAAAVTLILAFANWPEATAEKRIFWLGVMGCSAELCVAITIIALSSSRLGRVEVAAGGNHLTLDGRTTP